MATECVIHSSSALLTVLVGSCFGDGYSPALVMTIVGSTVLILQVTYLHVPPTSPNWMIDLMLVRGMNSKCLNILAAEFLKPNPDAIRRLATYKHKVHVGAIEVNQGQAF